MGMIDEPLSTGSVGSVSSSRLGSLRSFRRESVTQVRQPFAPVDRISDLTVAFGVAARARRHGSTGPAAGQLGR
jgi:hypothetical protein